MKKPSQPVKRAVGTAFSNDYCIWFENSVWLF